MSLLEVLISLTILTIAGTGLFLTSSISTVGNTQSRDRAVALSLAIEKMENLKVLPLSALVPGSYSDPTGLDASGASGGIYDRSWTIKNSPTASSQGRTIDVTVTWTGGDDVSLSTLVVEPSFLLNGFPVTFPTVSIRNWSQKQ